MKLRARLLIAFTGVALVVITLFGSIAYHITRDFAAEEETHLLQSFAQERAKVLSKLLQNINEEKIDNFLSRHESNLHYPGILLNQGNELVSISPNAKTLFPKYIALQLEALNIQANDGGSFEINNTEILWALATIPDTGYKLVIIHNTDGDASFIESVGAQLLVTGIITISLAIWGALILASFISKRLDGQNNILVHQALHDHLTDLPNRYVLSDRLQQAIYYCSREGLPVSLLLLDLKRFKEINDTLGHRSGDTLLKQIGPRLKSILWEPDTIARVDGDVFAVLLPKVGKNNLDIVINKITAALEKPFPVDDLELETSVTIGVAIFPESGKDPDGLIRQAHVALFQTKKNGRDFTIYSAEADPHSIEQLTLMSELRQALNNNELELYYQPKIDLKTQQVIGAEALIRWQHPERGFIPPDDFIPKAEQSGLIRPLTSWVLEHALKQSHDWYNRGINISIAVNVSQRSLYDQQLTEQIAELMQKMKIGACSLDIEITETAIMADPVHSLATLYALKLMGIKLSIDDFGTGFTSLSHLKELPIDELKIDKSFVMNMAKDNKDVVIVSTIIELAHSMGRSVVAEGVESQETMSMLIALGCDTAQGFYMTKPLPALEFENWLKMSNWHPAQYKKPNIA